MPKRLYLLDGSNLFWRAFHAPMDELCIACPHCHGLAEAMPCDACENSGVEPTKATYLFSSQLLRIMQQQKPAYMAVCFDGPRSALKRRAIFKDYKANREDKEECYEVTRQLKRIKQIVRELGVNLIECRGYEADDAIATLATQAAGQGINVSIVSRDKDLRQLCMDHHIIVFDPVDNKWYNWQNAGKRWGVEVEKIKEYLVLTGDKTDNIPGIPGVGEKTATKLLQRYDKVEDMVIAATMNHLPLKLAQAICTAHSKGRIERTRKLLTLDTQVNLTFDPLDFHCPKRNLSPKVRKIFRRLRFRSLLRD